MKLGYDLCELVSDDIIGVMRLFKDRHITIFQLKKVDDNTYRFYIPIYQRFMVKSFHLKVIKSVGVLYYIILLFCHKVSMIGVISFVLSLFICNQFIFKVEIIGNNPSTTKLVTEVLDKNKIDVGDKKKSYHQLNDIYDEIKDSFKGKIDYLNIYQEGGVLFVKYTNSVSAKKIEKNFQNIYAKKDGVIKSIDVKSGNIVVKVNDYVQKGELLVSNTITSTSGKDKIIETDGSIKAYTYVVYDASIINKRIDEGSAFSYLLYKIRGKLGAIDKIDREKVLSYGIIEDKRVLKMQYVLIEEIASKEEN